MGFRTCMIVTGGIFAVIYAALLVVGGSILHSNGTAGAGMIGAGTIGFVWSVSFVFMFAIFTNDNILDNCMRDGVVIIVVAVIGVITTAAGIGLIIAGALMSQPVKTGLLTAGIFDLVHVAVSIGIIFCCYTVGPRVVPK